MPRRELRIPPADDGDSTTIETAIEKSDRERREKREGNRGEYFRIFVFLLVGTIQYNLQFALVLNVLRSSFFVIPRHSELLRYRSVR